MPSRRVPRQFGPYLTTEFIGRGGMGAVFRGEHADDGSTVAVKAFVSDELDHRMIEALRREAATLQLLEHPNVVRVVDADLGAEVPWYAMELLDGESLATWLKDQADAGSSATVVDIPSPTLSEADDTGSSAVPDARPTWDVATRAALSWTGQVAHALAYLHGHGIVHGDLKPANIVIAGERAVLVDFGLAARVERRVSTAGLRRAKSSGHTPAYTAPERFRREPMEPRTDLYALGCIIFEIVAGRRPFEGTRAAVSRGHLSGTPPRLADLLPEVPAELSELVDRLLAKHPTDRPARATEVVRSLELLGISATADAEPPEPPAHLCAAPLVGRADALAPVVRLLVRAAGGQGGTAAVLGVAGSGKSTFASHLIRRARALEFDVLVTAADAAATSESDAARPTGPFAAVRGVLDAIRRKLASLAADARADIEREQLGCLGLFDDRFPMRTDRLAGADDIVGTAVREVSRLVEALFGDTQLLVVFDDLQWFDGASRRVFDELTRIADDHRWVMLAVGRSDELAPPVEAPEQETVRLSELDPDQTASVLAALLGTEEVDDELRDLVHARTGGNPYYVNELMQLAVEDGSITLDPAGRWVGASGTSIAETLALAPEPETTAALTERRVSFLSPDLATVARAASVVGSESTIAVLEATTDIPRVEIYPLIGLLTRRGIFDPTSDALTVRFVHELMRDAVYASIPKADRGHQHRRTAEAYARLDGDPHLIAWHFEAAGQLAEASTHWAEAAQRALGRHAWSEAADRFGDAVRTAASAPIEDRLLLRIARLRALLEASEFSLVRDEAEEARLQTDEPRLLAGITAPLAEACRQLGDIERARELARESVRLARSIDDDELLCDALQTLGDATAAANEHDEAVGHYREAMALGRANEWHARAAKTLNSIALLHYGIADYDDALDCWQLALDSVRAAGDHGLETDVYMNIGNLYADRGQFEESDMWHARARELAEEIADPYRLAWISMNLGVAYGRRNDYRRARDAYERALRHHRRAGAAVPLTNCLVNIGADAAEQGHYAEACARLEDAVQYARRASYSRGEMYALITIGECYLHRGDLEPARRALRQGAAIAETLEDRYAQFASRCRRVWLATKAGDAGAAREQAAVARKLAEEIGSPAVAADCNFAEGLALASQGENDAACRRFETAYDGFADQGRRWWASVSAAHAAEVSADADGREQWRERSEAALDDVALSEESVPRRLLRALDR